MIEIQWLREKYNEWVGIQRAASRAAGNLAHLYNATLFFDWLEQTSATLWVGVEDGPLFCPHCGEKIGVVASHDH